MAWKEIPGRSGWLFKDDAVVPSFTYLGAGTSVANAAKTTAGVRTEGGVQTYIQTRKTTDAETVNRGEIDATSTLASVGVSGPQPASFFSSLPVSGAQPFGGQAYGYALTSMTDPTSSSWTTKPAGYTYYPGEGIGADAPITDMNSMFYDATTFNQDISSWDVSSVTNMRFMFFNNDAFNQNISTWNVSSVEDMSFMFNNADAFNQDISTWNVSSVTSMSSMFKSAAAFNNGGVALTWGTGTASVQFMSNMFQNADAFNQDISSWDVSSVTSMNSMFLINGGFNNGGVALTWTAGTGTASVDNMESMFRGATAFNQDISSWNVSSVGNMSSMFNNADAFNQDISTWNVSSVTSMELMFFSANQFNNGGVALTWTAGTGTANVLNMSNMFQNAFAFNQNLNAWNVTNIPSAPNNFATNATLFTADEYPIWGTNGGIVTDPDFANVVYLVNATGTVDGTPSLYASDVQGNALSANNGLASQAHDGITKFADYAMEGNGGVYFISGTNSITGGTLGSGEYTIECWCYPVENGNFEILSTRTNDVGSSDTGIGLVRRNTGELMVIRGNGTEVTSGTTFNDNAWNHIAVTRDSSNVTRAYVNGVKGLQYTDSRNYQQQGITIMDAQAISGAGGARWKGYIEDVRITKGVARYTGDTLTVPTEAFPTS